MSYFLTTTINPSGLFSARQLIVLVLRRRPRSRSLIVVWQPPSGAFPEFKKNRGRGRWDQKLYIVSWLFLTTTTTLFPKVFQSGPNPSRVMGDPETGQAHFHAAEGSAEHQIIKIAEMADPEYASG
jgi:hypothetical protein